MKTLLGVGYPLKNWSRDFSTVGQWHESIETAGLSMGENYLNWTQPFLRSALEAWVSLVGGYMTRQQALKFQQLCEPGGRKLH